MLRQDVSDLLNTFSRALGIYVGTLYLYYISQYGVGFRAASCENGKNRSYSFSFLSFSVRWKRTVGVKPILILNIQHNERIKEFLVIHTEFISINC